jgi:TonB family protein
MLASLVLVFFVALPAPASAQPPVVEAAVQQPAAASMPEQKPWPPEGVVRAGPAIVSPTVAKHVYPSYTPETMRLGLEGGVYMEAVVEADGSVGEVRVTRPLDPGLDDQAVRTLKQWLFEPGRRDGVAVPVLIEVEMMFTMRDGKPVRMAAVVPPSAKPVLILDPIALSKVEAPRLVHETKPNYTGAAMRARIEGVVGLDVLVGVDGRVSEARVTQSLDQEYGLDEQAVETVRQWRFAPGRRDGVPVPVVVEIQMTLTLRK